MDLPASTHQVEIARAEQYAREHDMVFFSVSAKVQRPRSEDMRGGGRRERGGARVGPPCSLAAHPQFSASIDAIFENGLMEVLARVQQGRLDVEDPASGVSWDNTEPDVEERGPILVDSGGQGQRSSCCS